MQPSGKFFTAGESNEELTRKSACVVEVCFTDTGTVLTHQLNSYLVPILQPYNKRVFKGHSPRGRNIYRLKPFLCKTVKSLINILVCQHKGWVPTPASQKDVLKTCGPLVPPSKLNHKINAEAIHCGKIRWQGGRLAICPHEYANSSANFSHPWLPLGYSGCSSL